LDVSQEPDANFDEIDGREQINLPSLDNGPHFDINKRNTFVELKVREEPASALMDALHYVKGAGGNYQLQRKVAPVSEAVIKAANEAREKRQAEKKAIRKMQEK